MPKSRNEVKRTLRRVAHIATLLILLCAAVPRIASGEVLAHLEITVMTLELDRASTPLNGTVHLTLHVHTRQTITQLDNVTLPDLSAFDVLGDERHIVARNGSDYREVLSLVPKRAGTFTVGPASIDAVNTVTGKPSRFSSNTVLLKVTPSQTAPTPEPTDDPGTDDQPHGLDPHILVSFAIWMLVLVAAGIFAIRFVLRRRRTAPVADEPPVVLPTPVPVERPVGDVERYARALETARRLPSRENVQALRTALRAAVGARRDETLADLTARLADGERGVMARALRAIERAAFIEDGGRMTALEEALPALEAALHRLETRP